MHILLDSSILLLRSYPDTCEDVYTSILIAVLFVSAKIQTAHMFINRGVTEQL